jgi:hypothetical protein
MSVQPNPKLRDLKRHEWSKLFNFLADNVSGDARHEPIYLIRTWCHMRGIKPDPFEEWFHRIMKCQRERELNRTGELGRVQPIADLPTQAAKT